MRKPCTEERMARSDSEENRSVALYWDFENLHAGLVEAKFGLSILGVRNRGYRVVRA